jgi:diaminopimelate decarboxylase
MKALDPGLWGLERRGGALWFDGFSLPALAREHGTPLYVASAARLRSRAAQIVRGLAAYPRPSRVAFSYKTNLVAGIIQVLHAAGLGAEVVNGYELWLARRLGVKPDDIVMNGPAKTGAEIAAAVEAGVGLLVMDGLPEIERVAAEAERQGRRVRVGLRLCPDVVPRGMNASSVTGSRRNQFGLDLRGGELGAALARLARAPRLELVALQAHVGSGIHDLGAFRRTAACLLDALAEARARGLSPTALDLGGGLGTPASREFSTLELLTYLGTGRLPRRLLPGPQDLIERYGRVLAEALVSGALERALPLPELVLEPGRALVSDAQLLVLGVGAVRERPGVGRFALTDGGAMSTSLMFLSELHAVLLANREAAPDGLSSVFGRVPSPMDLVYRNLELPRLEPGDLLAVMDAGAYFTSTASNFGGPRPPVVLLDDGRARVVRRRESFEDLARTEEALEGRGLP